MSRCRRPNPQTIARAFQTLGLEPGVSESDIRSAFRRLALDTHPDRHPNDPIKEERFKQVTEAYEILTNSKSVGKGRPTSDSPDNRNDSEGMTEDEKWWWDQFSGLFV